MELCAKLVQDPDEGDQGLKFGKLEEPKQMVQNQLQGALQIASLTKYHPLLSIVQ